MNNTDRFAAAGKCNRDVPVGKPGARQNCAEVVNISVFFDGTGNNKDVDEAAKKWSNPARLWRATQYLVDEDTPNHAIYVSGVGTPFNGTATDWMDETLMKVEDGYPGLVAGNGGTRRTEFGQANVNDQLRAVLMQNAAKLNLSIKPYVEKGKPANLRGLATALEAHGLITVINFSIFGFSRGAALARAFSNELLNDCIRGQDGVLRYNGIATRINFMGLFDTVASFGVPSKNVDTPFNEKNLLVSDIVERCVHYIAAHELRFSFPVDLIRKDGTLRSNWTENVYPGAHSDVGGGYEPLCQDISNNYARIPMRDMMREAVLGGARLLDYEDIRKTDKVLFETRYEVRAEVEALYRAYVAAVGAATTVEQGVIAHMKALYASWGTMTRQKIKTPDLIEASGKTGLTKRIGHPGIAREAALLLNRAEAKEYMKAHRLPKMAPDVLQVEGMRYRLSVRPEQWRLDAWQSVAPEPVLNFVRSCVHDSKAGFVMNAEPFSYFRPRGMAESSRNVLARGLDWLDDAAAELKRGVIKVYHRAEGVVVETWEAGKLMATHTYRVGEKFVVDTARAGVNYTVEVYQSGKQVLISAMKKGEQMVITSIDIAKREASAAAEATQKKAVEIADATQRKAGEFAEAAQKKATEVGRQIYNGASDAAKSAGQAVDSGMKTVEEGWQAARAALSL